MSTCSCIEAKTTTLTDDQVAELTDIFRLLGERNRLRLVLACLEAPRTVGALVEALDLSQTLVSHHLRLLRTAHILRGHREGRMVRYAIDDGHVRDVIGNMVAHLVEPHEHRAGSGDPVGE